MKFLSKIFTRDRLILLLACFVLYGNTLRNDYTIDDALVTQKDNITSKGFSAIPKILTTFYADDKGQRYDYRPVVKLSFAIEHQFFGTNSGVSHFFNILLYALCAWMVYRLTQLLRHPVQDKIPLFAALLFVCLPIHSEVVASLKNRDVLLCFIFSVNALCIVLHKHITNRPGILPYVMAFISIALAYLSKLDSFPYLAIIPAVLFIRVRLNWSKIFFYTIAMLVSFMLVRLLIRNLIDLAQEHHVFYYFENPLYVEKGIGPRTIALFNSLGFYCTQCLFPFKQSFYYGVESVPSVTFSGYALVGIVAACLLVWGMIYAFKKQRTLLLAGLFIFSASVSMYLNFFKPVMGIVADRFAFFCSLGAVLVIIALLMEFYSIEKKFSGNIKYISIGLLLVFGFMVVSRNTDWKNTAHLTNTDIVKYPNSAYMNYLQAMNIMAAVEKKQKANIPNRDLSKDIKQIRANLENAIRVAPDYKNALNFLSYILVFIQKDYPSALPYINKSLQIDRTSDVTFYKAMSLKALKLDSSSFYFAETLRLDSMAFNAYYMLAEDKNASGKYAASLSLYQRALAKGLKNETIYTGLAFTYLGLKDTSNAKLYCQKALTLNPNGKKSKALMQQLE